MLSGNTVRAFWSLPVQNQVKYLVKKMEIDEWYPPRITILPRYLLVCFLQMAHSMKLPFESIALVILSEITAGIASSVPLIWFFFVLYFDLRGSQIGLLLENLGILFFMGDGKAASVLHNRNHSPTLSSPQSEVGAFGCQFRAGLWCSSEMSWQTLTHKLHNLGTFPLWVCGGR